MQDENYKVEQAFTGTEVQVGPFVDLCVRLLGMKKTGAHHGQNRLDSSACTRFKSEARFLDHQIMGAAFMLQRTLGYVPAPAATDTYTKEMIEED